MSEPAERVTDKPDNKHIARSQGQFLERDFLPLSKAIRALIDLRPRANIYKFIAETLHELFPGSLIFVSTYDESSSTLYARAGAGLGNNVDKIICLLGRHPVGISVEMNEGARSGLGTGRLERVSGGLYELATGALSRRMCSSIEKLLNITSVHAAGLTWDGRIMGSVAILTQGKAEITSLAVIESFLNYAAVALRRRHEDIASWA